MAAVPATILLIEDDPDIRDAVREILSEAGYQVLSAGNGDEALRVLRRSPRPALILLDLMMPGVSGYQFSKELREDPLLRTVPIIVISAMEQISGYADAVGARAFLRKPVQPDTLLGAVAEYCGA